MTRDWFSRLWLAGVAGFALLLIADLVDLYSPSSLILVVTAGMLLFLSSFVSRPWDARRDARRKAGR